MDVTDEEIVAEINKLSNFDRFPPEFYGFVPDKEIDAAERELGVKFPRSYRCFLQHFGAAKMLGCDFDGLPNTRNYDEEMPYYLHLVDHTNGFRREWGDLPRHFVFVTDDGGDCTFWIDTSRTSKDRESPVVAIFAGRTIPVAENFLEFVRLLTDQAKLATILSADHHEGESNQSSKSDPKLEGSNSVAEDVVRMDADASRRVIRWLQIIPDRCPPDLPVLAQHFGVDTDSRDVFVYGPSADLTLEQQMDAFAAEAGFFANPVDDGETRHAYVSIDYIIDHFSGLPQASLFPQLKQVVLNAYDKE